MNEIEVGTVVESTQFEGLGFRYMYSPSDEYPDTPWVEVGVSDQELPPERFAHEGDLLDRLESGSVRIV